MKPPLRLPEPLYGVVSRVKYWKECSDSRLHPFIAIYSFYLTRRHLVLSSDPVVIVNDTSSRHHIILLRAASSVMCVELWVLTYGTLVLSS